jgi:hypothetical protein
MAVAGVMSAPLAANAANVTGFTAVDWTLSNDDPNCETVVAGSTINSCETQFAVSQAEVDFESNGVRIDINDNNDGSGIVVEQANFTTALGSSGWNLIGGLYNSNLGADRQDRNMMAFDTHSLVYDVYNHPAVDLVNVTGVGVLGMAGPANVAVHVVNDPTIDTTVDDAANAIVVAVSGSAMPGLDLGLSVVSADASDITDLTVTYSQSGFTAGIDYLTAGDIDTDAYSITLGYDFGNGFDVNARVDNMTDSSGPSDFNTDTTTFGVGYEVSNSMSVRLENYDYQDDTTGGTADYSQTTLSFISNF